MNANIIIVLLALLLLTPLLATSTRRHAQRRRQDPLISGARISFPPLPYIYHSILHLICLCFVFMFVHGSLAATTANPVDACWRRDSNWSSNRKKLGDCAFGFGSKAMGGKGGAIYIVTTADDDAVNPKPGTLRYGVTRSGPLWIVFARNMNIKLQNELIITSNKTIDGRGAVVHIAGGPCLTIQYERNVIIHGLNIHDCKVGKAGMVRSSSSHVGWRGGSDGDAISVFGSRDIWIDHNSFWNSYDGLIDVIHESTAITISNNLFRHHNKVMLLGHNDNNPADKIMKITVAFNYFGPGCIQRMPRSRYGYFHVANNNYLNWEMYAIGGSAGPTIRSEGNRYWALTTPKSKQVTKRENANNNKWQSWTWESINDLFLNGAYFIQSGKGSTRPNYVGKQIFSIFPAKYVLQITSQAGSLICKINSKC